jgi:steroid delta-isomerase-like uncharacterized protein
MQQMSQANKDAARRFYNDAFGKGDMALIDQMAAANFVDHNPPGPGMPGGAEGIKAVVGMFRTAFPDLKLSVEDQIAEGGKVVSRITFAGTHQGEMMGIPATGKQVKLGVVDILHFEGDKVVERWGQADMMGMMIQLGVVPPPGG